MSHGMMSPDGIRTFRSGAMVRSGTGVATGVGAFTGGVELRAAKPGFFCG